MIQVAGKYDTCDIAALCSRVCEGSTKSQCRGGKGGLKPLPMSVMQLIPLPDLGKLCIPNTMLSRRSLTTCDAVQSLRGWIL